jgi:hypothetical protein
MHEQIEVKDWLVNGTYWYIPTKGVDLSAWDNIELLTQNHDVDVFFAWNNKEGKGGGRLYRGKWNKGKV